MQYSTCSVMHTVEQPNCVHASVCLKCKLIIKVGSRFIVKVSEKMREEMKVKQNSNKCMKMKIKDCLELRNILIPPRAEL